MSKSGPSRVEHTKNVSLCCGTWPVCLGVTLFFLGLYLFAGGMGFYSTDGETMLRTTWAIVDKGRLSVPCDPGQPSAIQGRDGHCYSRYGLAQPLAAVPLYLVGKSVHSALPSLDYGEVLRFTMARLNQFVMALACGMMCALGGLLYRSARLGVVLALLLGLGTLALPYSRFYFSEPLTMLGFLIALYGAIGCRCSGKRLWPVVGGLGFGLAVLSRTTSALLLPLFIAYLWLPTTSQPGEEEVNAFGLARTGRVILFLIPVILLGLIQAGYLYWAFGDPLSGGYQGEGWQTPVLRGLYGLLFSPGKSLLLFVPLAVLAPWGWARWFIEGRRREALLFSATFVIWLLFHAGWWTWHGGWSWGPRFMVPMLPFLILPLGSLWQLGSRARLAVVALALAGFLIQLGGVLVDFNDYMLWINDEDKILFDLAYVPILGHWRLMQHGHPLDLAILRLPRWVAIAWGAICGAVMIAGGYVMRLRPRSEKAQ
jgi:hypothetical protein